MDNNLVMLRVGDHLRDGSTRSLYYRHGATPLDPCLLVEDCTKASLLTRAHAQDIIRRGVHKCQLESGTPRSILPGLARIV
jgi:hypothetical protein